MTVISLTTVGYSETLVGLEQVPYARLFTSLLLVSGAGIALYFVSVLTTFLVEGEFLQLRRRRKMKKQIEKLSDHIIVCGVGGRASMWSTSSWPPGGPLSPSTPTTNGWLAARRPTQTRCR